MPLQGRIVIGETISIVQSPIPQAMATPVETASMRVANLASHNAALLGERSDPQPHLADQIPSS